MKRLIALILALALLLPACALCEDVPNPIPVLSEDEITQTPAGLHHYMLVCIDNWDARKFMDSAEEIHTDGMVLVTVDELANQGYGRVMLTSFIRDMLIQRPDGLFGRLNNIACYFNTAENGRHSTQVGVENLIKTINTHFDLDVRDYIVVDFQSVQNIVDAIGGVDITITSREASYLKNYAISPSSTVPALSGAGTYHFSGHAAVIYMRIRKVANIEGETQDVGRTRRARIVLSAVAESLKDISYDDALKLLNVVLDNTLITNMSTTKLMDTLDLAMRMKGNPIESIRMPVDGTYEPMPVAGMATQQLDYIANRKALWDFLLQGNVVVDDEDW